MVVLSMSNAALMIAVGILGEYVGRIYEEGKDRPLYLVADAWNLKQHEEKQFIRLRPKPKLAPPPAAAASALLSLS